jgi:hypothetical protein
MCVKQFVLGLMVIACFVAPSGTAWSGSTSPSHKYKWTVRVPSDVKLDEVHVYFYADKCKKSSGEKVIKKGKSYTWESDKPFCEVGGNYGYGLVHKYCDGTDNKWVSNCQGAASCAYDIKMTICPKVQHVTGYSGQEYGFCPD